MRNRHQDALKTSVMLGHASQTSRLMQNVHHKYQNLPDPDIFAFDMQLLPELRQQLESQEQRTDLLEKVVFEYEQKLGSCYEEKERCDEEKAEVVRRNLEEKQVLEGEVEKLTEKEKASHAQQENQLKQLGLLTSKLDNFADLNSEIQHWKDLSSDQTRKRLDLEDQLFELHQELESDRTSFEEQERKQREKIEELEKSLKKIQNCRKTEKDEIEVLKNKIQEKETMILLQKDKYEGVLREKETLKLNCERIKDLWEREAKHKLEVEQRWVSEFRQETLRKLEEQTSYKHYLEQQAKEQEKLIEKKEEENESLKQAIHSKQQELDHVLDSIERAKLETPAKNAEQTKLLQFCRKLENENSDLKEQVHISFTTAEEQYQLWEEKLREKEQLLQKENQKRAEALITLAESEQRKQILEEQNQNLGNEVALLKKKLHLKQSKQDLQRLIEEEVAVLQDQKLELKSRRDEILQVLSTTTNQFRFVVENSDSKKALIEKQLLERNEEIRLLMARIQELSSKYIPLKSDATDVVLAKYIHAFRPAVPFSRVSNGCYLFGTKQVQIRLSNEKPVFRIGGGFLSFEKFLEQYAGEELDKILLMQEQGGTGNGGGGGAQLQN
ncbi:unnamed protein product [Amoebophrya sp. A120]|nr:unnamed protein product [Amoebophrya sp. A120]|eukprot:GSA120T00021128001.1